MKTRPIRPPARSGPGLRGRPRTKENGTKVTLYLSEPTINDLASIGRPFRLSKSAVVEILVRTYVSSRPIKPASPLAAYGKVITVGPEAVVLTHRAKASGAAQSHDVSAAVDDALVQASRKPANSKNRGTKS